MRNVVLNISVVIQYRITNSIWRTPFYFDTFYLLSAAFHVTAFFFALKNAAWERDAASFTRTRELSPWLLHLLLALFGVELLVRRWENALGVRDTFEDLLGGGSADA